MTRSGRSVITRWWRRDTILSHHGCFGRPQIFQIQIGHDPVHRDVADHVIVA
jgi:hypothetical protein